jgi:hypothetical protein
VLLLEQQVLGVWGWQREVWDGERGQPYSEVRQGLVVQQGRAPSEVQPGPLALVVVEQGVRSC